MNYSKKSNLFLTLLLSCAIMLVLGIGISAYLSRNINKILAGSEDKRNTPLSNINELKWKQKYKIFYRTDTGIYSILSDGTNKSIVYPESYTFLVLDTYQRILVRTKNIIFLIDENGQNQEQFFTGPADKIITDWRISPDESKVAIELSPDINNPNNRQPDEIYIINLKNKENRLLNVQTELEGYKHLNKFLWSKNSQSMYIDTTTFITPNEGVKRYFSYNLPNDSVTKIGEEAYQSSEFAMKRLENYVVGSAAVNTRRDGVYTKYYYSRNNSDGSKNIQINNDGSIMVNNEPIMFWLYNGSKSLSTCHYPGWLPDNNHIVIECNILRVIELDSKKVAILDKDGHDAQWFGQRYEELYNLPVATPKQP